MEDFQAKGATGIIMNPYTGEILALANQPTFNPNEFQTVPSLDVFMNRAVATIYEPGSIFKPLTVAMGLDSKAVTADTTFYDSGELSLNGFTIKNAEEKAYGQSSVQFALNYSLNTGMAFIQREVGREKFKEYMDRFWFGKKTGIDLPGELTGNLTNILGSSAVVRDINFATASYGQGIAVTPIQMITAFNAIVSDGQIRRPQILSEIRHKDGTVEKIEPQIISQAVSEETVNNMRNMLVDTVETGQAKKAGVLGYYIGGKTGTAQIPSETGGYGDATYQSFIEFGTLADTRFTMLISLDSPIGSRYADGSVVPVAQDLNEFLVNYFDISPDYDKEEPKAP
jgi:stage V sporulation protein D (sporulation-specific penicillin-binding protein)